MWDEPEWYEYLESKMGTEILEKYHPTAFKVESSLADLF
jgi:hypothetical protein